MLKLVSNSFVYCIFGSCCYLMTKFYKIGKIGKFKNNEPQYLNGSLHCILSNEASKQTYLSSTSGKLVAPITTIPSVLSNLKKKSLI